MQGLADLFRRDITRLGQELRAFPDDASVWAALPGIVNPAGNLALHLEGNLRHYFGYLLGGVPYTRQRDREFDARIPSDALVRRIEGLNPLIPDIVAGLTQEQLAAPYPEKQWGAHLPTSQFVFSLYGHFSFHLGQIGYLRRILTGGSAVEFAHLKHS